MDYSTAREQEIWLSYTHCAVFSRMTVTFEVKTISAHLQGLYLQTVGLFSWKGISAIKDKLTKHCSVVLTAGKRKEKGTFPSILVKAAVRTSELNAQVTHNPPAARWQLAPKSLEKLSALNRCLTIVFTCKSKSGRVNVPPSATHPLWKISYYSSYQKSSTHFLPKDGTWLSLFCLNALFPYLS